MVPLFGRRSEPERPPNPFLADVPPRPPEPAPEPEPVEPTRFEDLPRDEQRKLHHAAVDELEAKYAGEPSPFTEQQEARLSKHLRRLPGDPKPPGRPLKSQTAKRSSRFTVSANQEERARLDAAAEAEGVTLARWVREAALRELDRAEAGKSAAGAAEEVNHVRAELRRQGNNLNQIARALNQEAAGGPAVDRSKVLEEISRMRAVQHEMRAHLRALAGER